MSRSRANGGERRRVGQQSRYLNGGQNALMRGPFEPGDEIAGEWTHEQRIRMDRKFVARLERAFRRGSELCSLGEQSAPTWSWRSRPDGGLVNSSLGPEDLQLPIFVDAHCRKIS